MEVCNIVENMKTHTQKYKETLLPFQLQLQNDYKF